MEIDVHAFRNRLTAADLMLTAMIDRKLPPTLNNLTRLAETLAELKALISTAGNGADYTDLFDIDEIAATAGQRLALLAEAIDVRLERVPPGKGDGTQRLAKGKRYVIRKAVEDLLAFLIRAMPPQSILIIAPETATSLRLRGKDANGEPIELKQFLAAGFAVAGANMRIELQDDLTCCIELNAVPVL